MYNKKHEEKYLLWQVETCLHFKTLKVTQCVII